jgi:mono/diheme cytochrome c family protein
MGITRKELADRLSGCITHLITALLLGVLTVRARAADPTEADLDRRFAGTVRPFMETYCVSCHGREKPKAQFDLSPYSTMASVVQNHAHWALVSEKLTGNEMPPEEAKKHPTSKQRDEVIAWIQAMRRHEAEKNAGDPGPVLARRLSNAEYDYTIRDLTGVDLRPTREFPVDPANQAGFDNSGESLTMSPALLKKYLQAARAVADHLVLKPEGFNFAPHPVLAETDRDKYSILRIVDFYKRQPTDYADYFLAAWRYQHRATLGKRRANLADIAAETKISPKYLEMIWATLTEAKDKVGPISKLQTMWRSLPKPDAKQPDNPRGGCEEMRDFVVSLRKKLEWKFPNLELRGVSSGGQCFIMWKNRQYASHRRILNPDALEIGGVPQPRPVSKRSKEDKKPVTELVTPAPDPDLFVPADEQERAPYLASFERFCNVFPDAFFVSERGRMHIDDPNDKGRLLSAGFHNMMGYFRDDAPLMELILDESGRRELNRLWLEFDFVAFVPERQHVEFIFYERAESKTIKGPEFDFARSEDKDVTSETKIQRLADVYLAKARESLRTNGGQPMVMDVIADHFRITSANVRAIEKARATAEPTHLPALLRFAEHAYRRPLAQTEGDELLAFYRSLREKDGLSHEDAIRDSVVSVLMSPHFCYRIDLVEAGGLERRSPARRENIKAAKQAGLETGVPKAGDPRPLSDYALASRLSYFLWSSMPDEELLTRAAAGDLHKPEVLAAQARRMMKGPRTRGLAVEFGGNWLDFRRFEEHNAVDRERFPMFNDELRQAMFEEPVRFLLDVVRENRSVLEFLYAKHTFVNPVLARHYGMTEALALLESKPLARPVGHPLPIGWGEGRGEGTSGATDWLRFDNADRYERGGLLPMAVFQTKNAPGLRTSPVKRGYWVVRRVLGEQIPPPPAVVPELPHDEAKLDLPLREVLAKHREDKSCAACHARFDFFGLVFENYGPVGERREKDLGGRSVDTRATFPGGSERNGLDGLRAYIRAERQDDFLDNLARKLLAYALGRSLMLSDEITIREMRTKLAANGQRFGDLVESIVTSPQFRNKRGSDDIASKGK